MHFLEQLAIFFAIIIGILLVFLTFLAWVNRGERKKQQVIQNYEFPAEVSVGVKERYPHLTDDDVKLALEQLRLYFLICWEGDKNEVAMPSRLVDACWHGFILQTRSYQSFCRRAFGGFLHHAPKRLISGSEASATAAGTEIQRINLKEGAKIFQAALAMTDMVANASNNKTTSLRVPMLFAIDRMLMIPDGHLYTDEAIQLMGSFDWRNSRLSDSGGQSQSESDSASLGCGDGSVACGSCAGGH